MSFLDKLKERMDAVKETVSGVTKDLLVPDEVYKERLDICMSCEHLFEPTSQCKKCGCFVKAKTKVSKFSCPINKWTVYEIKSVQTD